MFKTKPPNFYFVMFVFGPLARKDLRHCVLRCMVLFRAGTSPGTLPQSGNGQLLIPVVAGAAAAAAQIVPLLRAINRKDGIPQCLLSGT